MESTERITLSSQDEPDTGDVHGTFGEVWTHGFQWRKGGVAAASGDGGPTGGRGPRQF